MDQCYLVSRAFNAIADDLPRGFSLTPGSLQANRPLSIPEDALREAIVNALVHQSLRVHRPIQIIRYSNRIEIINPGFSLKPVEALGEPGSEMRNPTIGSIFHETQLAEAKGTGIGTMRRLMKDAAMMPPTFESDHTRNIFTTRILLHHFLSEEDLKWFKLADIDELNEAQKIALIFLREVGAIDNITYRQLSCVSNKAATKELKLLINAGLIESRGQGRQTYYISTQKLKDLYGRKESKGVSSEPKGVSSEPKGVSSDSKGVSSDKNILLPTEIIERINARGMRNSLDATRQLIVDICKIQPVSIAELADILSVTEKYLRRIVPNLLRERLLFHTIPKMVNHPNQKYTVK